MSEIQGSRRLASLVDEPAKGKARVWNKVTVDYVDEYLEGKVKAEYGDHRLDYALREVGSRRAAECERRQAPGSAEDVDSVDEVGRLDQCMVANGWTKGKGMKWSM